MQLYIQYITIVTKALKKLITENRNGASLFCDREQTRKQRITVMKK